MVRTGESIVLNGKEIYQDIINARTAWNEKSYFKFGTYMGEIVIIMIDEGPITDIANDVDKDMPIKEFFRGIFVGIKSDIILEEVESCLNSLDVNLHQLILGFQNIRSKEIDGVRLGLKEIGISLKDLPYAISNCKPNSLYYAGIIKHSSDAMINPISIGFEDGKSMSVNGKEIYVEMTESIRKWGKKDWESCGEYAGKALKKIFLRHTEDTDPYALLISSLPESSYVLSLFSSVLECSKNSIDTYSLLLNEILNYDKILMFEHIENLAKEIVDSIYDCVEREISDMKLKEDNNMLYTRDGEMKINFYWILEKVNDVLKRLD